jgi:peptidoglycan/xylan/chitin deacetylase (PgdA/CDA1 family)
VADGHELANHSYTHPNFRTIGDDQIIDEINRTEALIGQVAGVSAKPGFRFPYGARDGRTRAVVAALGYTSVFWTLDSLDSVGPPKTPQFLIDRIVKSTVNGSIILVHVGSASTAAALPAVLTTLTERGLRLVTMTELLA